MSSSRRVTAALLITLSIALPGAPSAFAQDRYRGHDFDRGEPPLRLDQRYHHDHYYPARGYAFAALPRDSVRIGYRGGDYYYHGGVWMRPDGDRFIVAAPPFGIGVAVLPPAYATVSFGGSPYYYANGVYYAPDPGRGYTVVAPPDGADVDGDIAPSDAGAPPQGPAAPQYGQPLAGSQPYAPPPPGQTPYDQPGDAQRAAPGGGEPVIYPRNNQSPQQVAADKAECYRWATQNNVGAGAATFGRAFAACMDGHGYSLR